MVSGTVENYPRMRECWGLPQPAHKLIAIHGGHQDVANHQIRVQVGDFREGLGAIGGFGYGVAEMAQNGAQVIAAGRIVFDDKNVSHGLAIGLGNAVDFSSSCSGSMGRRMKRLAPAAMALFLALASVSVEEIRMQGTDASLESARRSLGKS